MNHPVSHHAHHHHLPGHSQPTTSKRAYFRLALSATLHCLLGCGLGEVTGMMIGTWLGWSNMDTMILALSLGMFFGLLLGLLPLLRAGFSFPKALRQVIIAEGLSIVVMESVELLVQVYTPGVMDAHLTDGLFWLGMILGLIAGFIAAFPINYAFVKRGIRHLH